MRERPPRPGWPATARHSSTGTSPARGNLFRRPAGLADGLALKEPAPPTALYREIRPNLWVPRSRTPHPGFGVDARQPARPAGNYAMSSYPREWWRATRAVVARLSYRSAPDAPSCRRPRLPARRARRDRVRPCRSHEDGGRLRLDTGPGRQGLDARGLPRPRLPGLRDEEH